MTLLHDFEKQWFPNVCVQLLSCCSQSLIIWSYPWFMQTSQFGRNWSRLRSHENVFPAINTATRTDLKNAFTYLVPLKVTKKKVFIALAPSPTTAREFNSRNDCISQPAVAVLCNKTVQLKIEKSAITTFRLFVPKSITLCISHLSNHLITNSIWLNLLCLITHEWLKVVIFSACLI